MGEKTNKISTKAYMMTDLMRSVVKMGTGRTLKYWGVDWPVAGKTGTTNDSRDTWFVGYTPDILALVWIGFDNGDSWFGRSAHHRDPSPRIKANKLPKQISG